MALQDEAHTFMPEACAESEVSQRGASRRRASLDPDAQAIEIATRVAEKIAVARSLMRIASVYARENANVAGDVLRRMADEKMAELVDGERGAVHLERARRIAAAAADAARHAAQLAAARASARVQDAIHQSLGDEEADEST
jgi:hypothetical protein